MKKIFNFLLQWIITDPTTKIMALLLAVIVWFFLDHEYTERSKEPIEVPLKLIVPDNIIALAKDLQGNPVDTIKIVLEGPRGVFKENPRDIVCWHKVEVPANFINEVTRIEDIKEKDFFNLPPRIKVRQIDPARILIILLEKGKRFMRLETKNRFKGVLPEGYEIQVKTEPSEILVYGPKKIIALYKEIPIEPIDIEGRTSSFSLPGKIIKTLDGYPIWTEDSFIVRAEIIGGLEEKRIRSKINILQPQEFQYVVKIIKPTEIELKFKGPAEVIEDLKPHHVNVFVNISKLYSDPQNIKPGRFKIQAEYSLAQDAPKDITLAEPLNQVTVEVTESK